MMQERCSKDEKGDPRKESPRKGKEISLKKKRRKR
jgi:hypothetical protein